MTGPALTAVTQMWADRAEVMETASRIVPLIEEVAQMRERAWDLGRYYDLTLIEEHLRRARVSLIRLYEEV